MSFKTEYTGSTGRDIAETTVQASAMHPGANVVISPADTDGDASNGHQAAVQQDAVITVTVMSEDRSATRVYRVTVEAEPLQVGPPLR